MRGSTKKPVVRTKIHSLRLKTKKPKESDRDVRDKLEKEAGDAWDEYDKHMKESLGGFPLVYLRGARIKQPNYALQHHRLKRRDDEDAHKRGYKDHEEWVNSDEFKAERAAKQKKWQDKNARAIKKIKKKGEHSGRLTKNKAGTVVSVGKRTRDERNEKIRGLFKNTPKLKRKPENVKNYAHEKGTSVPITIKRLRDMFKEGKDVTLSGRNSIDADTSKKQETWKMNKELKNAIAKAIKASRAQIISTYGKPISPGKVNPRLNEERTKLAKTLKSLHEKHSRNQLRQALNYHSDAIDYYDIEDDEKKQARHSQAYRTAQKMLGDPGWKKEKNWTDLSDDKVYGKHRRRNDPVHKLKMTIKKAKRKKAASR